MRTFQIPCWCLRRAPSKPDLSLSGIKAVVGLSIIVFLSSPMMILQAITLTSTARDVYIRGTREQTGTVEFIIDHDAFPQAGSESPNYMRITFPEQVVLSETLVDSNHSDPRVNQPIYLSMILTGGALEPITLDADAETLSIVRWAAGENEFWIRVNQSTSSWVSNQGLPTPPTEDFSVIFFVGISAATSIYLGHVLPSRINLPFNTREPATTGNPEDAVSTLFCLDLSEASLQPGDLLEYDLDAYDQTAQVGPGIYEPGTIIPLPLEGSTMIGNCKTRSCYIDAFPSGSGDGNSNPGKNGMFLVETNLLFQMSCGSGGLLMDTLLWDDSWLVLEADPSLAGFEQGGLRFTASGQPQTLPGIEVVDPSSMFVRNGKELYSRVFLFWNSGIAILDDFNLSISSVFVFPPSSVQSELYIDWTWMFVNNDGPQVDEPFHGAHQNENCAQTSFEAGSGRFTLAFDDCVQINPSVLALGLDPGAFGFESHCPKTITDVYWATEPQTPLAATGNNITLEPAQTTAIGLIVGGNEGYHAFDQALLLVSANPGFFDYNQDGCNNILDIWALAPSWNQTFTNDPNSDQVINILDFFYLNLDDSNPCP